MYLAHNFLSIFRGNLSRASTHSLHKIDCTILLEQFTLELKTIHFSSENGSLLNFK